MSYIQICVTLMSNSFSNFSILNHHNLHKATQSERLLKKDNKQHSTDAYIASSLHSLGQGNTVTARIIREQQQDLGVWSDGLFLKKRENRQEKENAIKKKR